jgi:dipeptidyl aminopeptidase/acylaminoacyl peptidase
VGDTHYRGRRVVTAGLVTGLVYYADGSFYITDPGATNPRPVTETTFTAYNNYLLSPDGAHIAILGTEASSEVDGFTPRLIDIATGDVQATAAAAPDTTTAAIFWSPDGRHLVTVSGAPNRLDVTVLDVATGSARTLSTELPDAVPVQIGGVDPAQYYNPTINSGWDSTGQRLVVWVVTNFTPYRGRLLLIDLEAETLTLFGDGQEYVPTWSLDGRYVLAEVWASGAADPSQPAANVYAIRQRVPEHAAALASLTPLASMYWLPDAPHTLAYVDPGVQPSPLTLLDVASGREMVLADDTMLLLYVER